MKLSKALRVKNQLIHKINKLQRNILKYNSYNANNKPKWDVIALMEEQQHMVTKLLELKTAISLANRPIVQLLHHVAETKAQIKFLNDLPIKQGVLKESYSEKEYTFECFIDEISKATRIDTLTESIYTIEDTLAKHNASVEIDFVL